MESLGGCHQALSVTNEDSGNAIFIYIHDVSAYELATVYTNNPLTTIHLRGGQSFRVRTSVADLHGQLQSHFEICRRG